MGCLGEKEGKRFTHRGKIMMLSTELRKSKRKANQRGIVVSSIPDTEFDMIAGCRDRII